MIGRAPNRDRPILPRGTVAYCPAMTTPRTGPAREAAVLVPPVVAFLALLQIATGPGSGHLDLALAAVVVAIGHVLPGALVWRLVRPERGWLVEDLALGLGIGVALAVPGHVLAVAVGAPALGVALPLAVGAGVLVVPASRRRVLSRRIEPLPWTWGAATTVSALVPALLAHEAYAQPLRFRGWALQYVDLPYHTALAHAVSERFPPHYPQVAEERLTYHWFTHAWTAQVSAVSDTGVDVLLWRFNPSLLAVAVPVVAAVAAMRITGRTWAGPAAAAVAFLLLDVAPWGPSGLTDPLASPMSPTQQFGLLVLLTLVTVLVVRWRGEGSRASWPVLLLLLVVTGGSKGSTLPVLVAGALAAAGAVLLLRERDRSRTVGLDAILAAACLLVLNRFMFGGGDGGVSLDLGEEFIARRGSILFGRDVDPATPLGLLALVLATLPFVLSVLGALALVGDRSSRRDPVAWLLLGGGGAGLGAVVLLTHPGGSQGYFYKAGEPLLALAGVWGTCLLWERAGARRALLLTGVATGPVALLVTHLLLDRPGAPGVGGALASLALLLALVAAGAVVGARVTRSGAIGGVATASVALLAAGIVPTVHQVAAWRAPEAVVGVAKRPTPNAIHSDDLRALRWLGAHSERGDLVATNKHCLGKVADPCDRRRFFVGASSGRGVLIEGWTYNRRVAPLYREFDSAVFRDDQFWDPALLELNDGFIATPSADGAAGLWALGVRWVVVWHDAPHANDLAPYADRVRRGRTMDVYRLNRPTS